MWRFFDHHFQGRRGGKGEGAKGELLLSSRAKKGKTANQTFIV